MKTQLFLLTTAFILLFSGCGQIEDDIVTEVSYDNYTPPSNNQCSPDNANSQGCFGNEPFFGDNQVDSGYWVLYKESNNYDDYYDMYFKSYQFTSKGAVVIRNEDEGNYKYTSNLWGVNSDADTIAMDSGEALKYDGTKYGGDCYKITYENATYKMCHEDAIEGSQKNSAGYYGDEVKFGNYIQGDYEVAGTWSIDGVSFSLDSNGSTSTGGKWGVSLDAKSITIDAMTYLVDKYPGESCIDTYIIENNYKISPTTLCKL